MIAIPIAVALAGVIGYFMAPGRLYDLLTVGARRIVGLEKKTTIVDGIVWTYLEGGRTRGETVVLVHGFGADKDNWLLWAWYLRRRVHLICPDLPGFGESGMDPDSDYSSSTQADRLHRFLEVLGVGRCHLAGNSMGGLIAIRIALQYPNSLATMTLIDPAGVSSSHKNAFELGVDRGERELVLGRPEDLDQLLKLVMHEPPPAPRRLKRVYFERAKEREKHLTSIFDGLTEERHSPLDEHLYRIETPTLIIWGRQDQILDVSGADVLSARVPTNRCELLDETGHVPMIERPKETALMQLEFMGDAMASGELAGGSTATQS